MRFATSFAALAFLVIGVCLASPTTTGMGGWVGKATAHFAIFTAEKNDGGQELLERLERARLFFEKTGWASRELKQPLSILAFNSQKEFDTYKISPGAFAFYQRTREGDFVLMRSLEPEHYSIVVHEYTHFIVEHSGLKLPLWLNEGLADYYSTLESRDAKAVVGMPPPGREESLRKNNWIDWPTLVTVDRNSPYYRQPDKMMLFYSQSWAFARVLALDADYAAKFPNFLTAVSGPSMVEQALTSTYQKSLPDVGRDVEQFFKAKRPQPQTIELDIRSGLFQTAEVANSGKQAEFALAYIQAANPGATEEARVRLETLAAKYPEDPHAEESLGFLSMRSGRTAEAEQHLSRAVKGQATDPETLFALAHLQIAHNEASDEAIDLLQRALAVNGTHYNALLELGFAAARTKKFDIAVQALEKINKPKAEDAYNIPYTLAYCLSELHLNNKARQYAELALKTAGTTHDKGEATELLSYIKEGLRDEVSTK